MLKAVGRIHVRYKNGLNRYDEVADIPVAGKENQSIVWSHVGMSYITTSGISVTSPLDAILFVEFADMDNQTESADIRLKEAVPEDPRVRNTDEDWPADLNY